MGKTKDMAEDAEPKDITNHSKINFTTSPIALATGALNESKDAYEVTAKEGRKGEVTVTVKVEGLEDKTVKLQITNEERKVDASQSTISTEAVTVATGATETFTVELKDQYGDAVTGAAEENATPKLTVDGVEAVTATVAEDTDKKGTYTVTVKGGDKAAKGDLTVKVGETEIGKVAVEVQEAGEVATWELKPSVTEIDLKNVTNKKQDVEFTVVAKDEKGLTVTDHGKELVLKKDGKVVDDNKLEVTLDDLKVGQTFEFELFEKNGALVDSLGAKATVTVVDTTPTLEKEVTFTSLDSIKIGEAIDLSEVVQVVATTSEGKKVATKFGDIEQGNIINIVDAENDAIVLGEIVLTVIDLKIENGSLVFNEGAKEGTLNISVFNKNQEFLADIDIDFEDEGEE